MKLLLGIFLSLIVLLFAFMQWGGTLLGTSKNAQTLGPLNAEKIKLLDVPMPQSMAASAVALPPQPASAVTPVSTLALAASAAESAPVVLAASAPVAASQPAPTIVIVPKPASAPSTPTAGKLVTANACMEWGEFSGTDWARAEKELAVMHLGDHLSKRTVEYASGYWVYIPPLPNKAAVNKRLEQIKSQGVQDFYIVQEPPAMSNAISLGVFKTNKAAKSFYLSLKKKGIRGLKIGKRKGKLKFTVYVFNHIDTAAATHLATLQKSFANSELKKIACN